MSDAGQVRKFDFKKSEYYILLINIVLLLIVIFLNVVIVCRTWRLVLRRTSK